MTPYIKKIVELHKIHKAIENSGGDSPSPSPSPEPTPTQGKPWLEGLVINENLENGSLSPLLFHKKWAFYDSTGSIVPSNFEVLTDQEVQEFTENDLYMGTVIPLFGVEEIEQYLNDWGESIPEEDVPVEITYTNDAHFVIEIRCYYNTIIHYAGETYDGKIYFVKHTFDNGETYYVIYG